MKKICIFLFAAFLIPAGFLYAFSGPMPPGGDKEFGGPGAGGPDITRFSKELRLTFAQVEQLKNLNKEAAAREKKFRSEMMALMEKIRKMIESEKPDIKAVYALVDRTAAIEADMMKAKLNDILRIKSILTPEQDSKMRELLRKDMEKNMDKKYGPHGPPPPEF